MKKPDHKRARPMEVEVYLDGGKKARRAARLAADFEYRKRVAEMAKKYEQKPAHERARLWRTRMGLSVAQLAALTGYSDKAIYWFEQGLVPRDRNAKAGDASDRKIKANVWRRYQTACAGVAAQIFHKRQFDW